MMSVQTLEMTKRSITSQKTLHLQDFHLKAPTIKTPFAEHQI
jgi:hypothetical protein